ncbi:FecR domain-containing protein [uncultured Bacteroides sp.]|jgi:transmembrane sensor|uniref:FecR family protein n=1 Tax=uncultured Bacteroides sp. TaxID=162156 RepID=UPI0027DCBAE7|nr:FecR domain-containing protein [uncultured Bacteroides sp.]
MDIEKIKELIIGHFEGNLTGVEKRELVQWLKASDENRKVFAEMADYWGIAHLPYFASHIDADLHENFGMSLNQRQELSQKRFSLFLHWKRLAVAILVLLAVSGLSYYSGYSSQDWTDEVVCFETVVPLGARSKVVLPDQSVVWVNAGSSLRYDKNFLKEKREVYLKGEAFFEVTPDSLKPFVVKSEELAVKVLGTSFNIRTYEDEEEVDVVLLSGKVDVYMNRPVVLKHPVHLNPNEQLTYEKGSEKVFKREVEAADICAWVTGEMKFTKAPFSSLIKELERKYNVKLKVETSALLQEQYTGSFTSEHTIYDILHEINIDGKYEWKQNGNEFTIHDRM